MKKYFLLIIFLPLICFAQNKKDNTIVIHDSLSPKQIKDVLFTIGYEINRSDSDFISTNPRYVKGLNIKVALQKKNNTWVLKGWARDNAFEKAFLGYVD